MSQLLTLMVTSHVHQRPTPALLRTCLCLRCLVALRDSLLLGSGPMRPRGPAAVHQPHVLGIVEIREHLPARGLKARSMEVRLQVNLSMFGTSNGSKMELHTTLDLMSSGVDVVIIVTIVDRVNGGTHGLADGTRSNLEIELVLSLRLCI